MAPGTVAVRNFPVGAVCFGKLKGYPAWPGIILAVEGNRYKIKFFGDQTW